MLLRGWPRGTRRVCGEIFGGGGRAVVFSRAKAVSQQSADAKLEDGSTAGSLVFRHLGIGTRSARSRGCAGRPDFLSGSLHGESSGRVVFVSARWNAHRPHGGGDQISAASSIASLARRSACLLASRRTCSKETRPISCVNSCARACSGFNAGCFTL